ncbi:MAG: hypothetical protein IJ108_00065 [Eubacterium sp.]|nr:hypothetical protein [Eubacterium sp.]
MSTEQLYDLLQTKFRQVLSDHHLEEEAVTIHCRALSPEEAIGVTRRKDFPIIAGKDIMVQAEYRDGKGQAFTDAPADFSGTLADVADLDITSDAHARGIFIASMNAVMNALGRCKGTVHCRTEGPELCAKEMEAYLTEHYADVKRVGLVGYQPALLEMLANSEYEVRVLDLNPANIGEMRYGVPVEDGATMQQDVKAWADLVLCTGSTLCNGTIVDYLGLEKEVLFFGITIAGAEEFLGVKRVCFADRVGD